ncbi:putative ABC transporter permease protein [Gordonia hirsuta DSM 44140 = NBRC 16056]|uniref:Transport permease protein n=1 Tax=Gordonia hirsuta DSM 44140 = NBRC 16056 TaxID=1121927 RepID=L7LBL3_9ACTN|nr:ABC transporter permease [Gordonia hirsuta]GAC57447.1 putative ABC transporter permease protein [Gordonia hirsuta DSM 44140 = NBRC 16056]
MTELRTTVATALRVLQQLRADPRTVVMLIAIPSVVLTMLYYMFSAVPVPPGQATAFDRVATAVLGIMPFTAMFLVTSIAVLRERSSGTLERVLSTPISKGALMAGYAVAFALFAAVQAAVACALAFGAFDLTIAGSVGAVIGVCVLIGMLGIALGLLCSAFAQTEFQAMQFMPALVFPQLFLCGLFVPRAQLPDWMQYLSDVMPLTFAVQALEQIRDHTAPTALLWRDIAILAGFTVAALALGAATLRRRTA